MCLPNVHDFTVDYPLNSNNMLFSFLRNHETNDDLNISLNQIDGLSNGGHFRVQTQNNDEEEGSPSKTKDVIMTPSRQSSVSARVISADKRGVSESGNVVVDDNNNNGSSRNLEMDPLVTSPKPAPPAPLSSTSAVAACINYSFCSVSMILVNKSLASRYV